MSLAKNMAAARTKKVGILILALYSVINAFDTGFKPTISAVGGRR